MTATMRRQPMRLRPTRTGGTLVAVCTVVLVITLLSGTFSLERLGFAGFFVLPERFFVGLALAIICLPIAVRHARRYAPAVVVALPLLLLLISALWAPDGPTLSGRVLDITLIVVFVLVGATLVIADAKVALTSAIWTMAVIGLTFSIAGPLLGGDRVALLGGGPNVYGRITGLGFIMLMWLLLTHRAPRWMFALVPVPLAATVLSGSRGAMLSLAVAIFVSIPYVLRSSRSRAGSLLMMGGVGVLTAWALFGEALAEVFNLRIVELTIEEQYTSGRDPLYAGAVDIIREHPVFGAGLDAFSSLTGSTLGAEYPHNMVLQYLAELGVVGGLLLTVIAIWVGHRLLRFQLTEGAGPLVVGAVLHLVAQQFSGGHYDGRFFWVLTAMALVAAVPRPVSSGTRQPVAG